MRNADNAGMWKIALRLSGIISALTIAGSSRRGQWWWSKLLHERHLLLLQQGHRLGVRLL